LLVAGKLWIDSTNMRGKAQINFCVSNLYSDFSIILCQSILKMHKG